MKIIAAATPGGAAEALAPVIRQLLTLDHAVTVVGVNNDAPETRGHGGSANVFRSQNIPFTDLFDLGYRGSAVQVSGRFGRSLVEAVKPDRILVGCVRDPSGELSSMEDALIDASRDLGIRVVQVIDGWDVWFPRVTGRCAVAFAVPDPLCKKILARRGGIPEDAISVTGQPALDSVRNGEVGHRRQQERERLQLGHTERVLLYCGQVTAQNPLTLRWTVNAMRSNDRLIFQRHPRDQRDYTQIVSSAGRKIIGLRMSSAAGLSVADVCVTHYSTMGLRAASLGIPIVNILLEDELQDIREMVGGYPLSCMGLSREVHSEAELAAVLSGDLPSLDIEDVRRALGLDGRVVGRIVDLLVSEAGT